MPLLPADDGIAEHADALDLGLDHVTRLEVEQRPLLGRLESGHAGHGARREHVACGVAEPGEVGEDLGDRHGHVPGVRLLPHLTVDPQLHAEIARVGHLVGGHDPRAERAEGVDRLAEREDARAHLATLDVARGEVVEDHVAADVVAASSGVNHFPAFLSTTASSSS